MIQMKDNIYNLQPVANLFKQVFTGFTFTGLTSHFHKQIVPP